jgi:diaminohydroxyphosphoribosylaminopyrimidine deaminase/5-amino-6-(5-phosphoribosylamino)uracil reductase
LLAKTAEEFHLIIVKSKNAVQLGESPIPKSEILPLPADNGRPSVLALLDELGRRRMTNMLVEGGSAVLGSIFDARAIDEVHVFIAPRLAGGALAKTPIGGLGIDKFAATLGLAEFKVEQVGQDVLIHGRIMNEDRE